MVEIIPIALGGSLLSRKEVKDLDIWRSEIIDLLSNYENNEKKFIIIIGGGHLARKEIGLALDSGVNDKFELDLIGIRCTRKNAFNFMKMFEDHNISVNKEIPESIEDAIELLSSNDLVVMGGTSPGQTTDAVAIKIGIRLGVKRVFVATNVSHIFSEDPKINKNAKKIKSISLKELGILSGVGSVIEPGASFAVDPVGVSSAINSNLPLVILNGHDVDNLRKAINGEEFIGTNVFGD